MKILNVTHGSFYAFGAYGAAIAVGIYFDRGLPAAGGFLLMVLVAMAIGLVLGLILERGLLRLVYGKDEVVVVLVTYAAFLILEDVIQLIWGTSSYALYQPLDVTGNRRCRRARALGLRHRPCRLRRAARGRRQLRAQVHTMGPPAHRRDLRPRARRCLRHQRVAGLHVHLRHRRHAGRARRRGDGAENRGDAGHRRRGDRARLRGGRDRRHGLDRRRLARRARSSASAGPRPCTWCRRSSCSSSTR